MKIQNALVLNIPDRSQRYFAHVTTVTLSWRVQNIVVIGRVYFTLECFEFSSNFEFDRYMLSGTGARSSMVYSADTRHSPDYSGIHRHVVLLFFESSSVDTEILSKIAYQISQKWQNTTVSTMNVMAWLSCLQKDRCTKKKWRKAIKTKIL